MRYLYTPAPEDLVKTPEGTELSKMDFYRAGKFLRGEFPLPLPPIHEVKTSSWVDCLEGAPYLVIDTETTYSEERDLLTLGIGGPGTPICQWWPYKEGRLSRERAREDLLYLVGRVPIVFQNAMFDIPVLESNMGIEYKDYLRVDDTLLLDSVLWTEYGHTLGEATRRYGRYEKLKHLPMNDPLYNAGDIAETINFWEGLQKDAVSDAGSSWIYENSLLPLIPIILEAHKNGLRVDRGKVKEVESLYLANRAEAVQIAQSYAGFPINLGSPGKDGQLGKYLEYDLIKNWGFKQKVRKGKKVPLIEGVGEDEIAGLREKILPFDPSEEVSIESLNRRISEGGHPILEARVLFSRATQWLSHYIQPMLESGDGRVYPQFHPWVQNSGRWSTVGFPAAQLPNPLRKAIIPDDGWEWFEGDWSAIELRLIAALSGDPIMLEAFSKNWDLHTFHLCEGFNFPSPKGWTKEELKSDKEWLASIPLNWDDLRTFMKATIFRLCYGGKAESAPSIPGAKGLGFSDKELVSVSKSWVSKHPAINRFWKLIERDGLRTRSLRTALGRKWLFLGHDPKRILRQMYDFPMQGFVADWMNLTLIEIKRRLGDRVRLAYTMHDSIKLQLRKTPALEADIQTVVEIFERTTTIAGREINFPGEYHRRS